MSKIIEQLILESGSTGNHQVWFTRKEIEKFGQLLVAHFKDIVATSMHELDNESFPTECTQYDLFCKIEGELLKL